MHRNGLLNSSGDGSISVNIGGCAGLVIACAILEDPSADHTLRALARITNRSPSTVSEAVNAMRVEGPINAKDFGADAELCWRVAGRWHTRRTYLEEFPVWL
jgi:hypothetical protein